MRMDTAIADEREWVLQPLGVETFSLFARQPWNRFLGLRRQVIPGGMWTAMDGAECSNRAERGGAAQRDFQVIASKSDGAGVGFCFGFFFLKWLACGHVPQWGTNPSTSGLA